MTMAYFLFVPVSSLPIIKLAFCCLFFWINFMAGSSTVIHWACNGSHLGLTAPYQNTVKSVLHNLVDKRSEFTAIPEGETHNETTVYGLFQCLGDVSQYDCNICGEEARYFLQHNCPDADGASLWSNWCFLRLESHDFISKLETRRINAKPPCSKSHGSREKSVVGVLQNLMQDVGGRAPDEENYFASKSVGGSFLNLDVKIKGRAQCWRDLSKEECAKCLWNGLKEMEECYDKRNSKAEFLSKNCILTYEMTFLGDSSSNPGVWLRKQLGKSPKLRKLYVESGSHM